MSGNYFLGEDGRTPVPAEDLKAWSKWFEKSGLDRRVARTKIDDNVEVSTVFLGVDHAFMGGPPKLFETLVMGGEHDGEQHRCSTWEEALAQHADVLLLFGLVEGDQPTDDPLPVEDFEKSWLPDLIAEMRRRRDDRR